MFPKIIWRYWEQGWDKQPFVVRYCSQSVFKYADDWEIRNLDGDSIKQYVDFDKYNEILKGYPIQIVSDFYRSLLLKKFGGVWLDATVFLNSSLTEYLSNVESDYFCLFRYPWKVGVSSWFLAAQQDSYIAKVVFDTYKESILSEEFLRQNQVKFSNWKSSPNYFWWHRVFENNIQKDEKFKHIIINMPFGDSGRGLLSVLYGGYNTTVTKEMVDEILSDFPVFKLGYNLKEQDYNPKSFLACLVKKMNDEVLCEGELHTSRSTRSFVIYNSYVGRPDKVGEYAGQFESEGDIGVLNNHKGKYHIYNFVSIDKKHGAQLLIPYDKNRVFLRTQSGNSFSNPVELANKEDVTNLHKEIDKLKNTIFWQRFIYKVNQIMPSEIRCNQDDMDRSYVRFYIKGVDQSIHYELMKKGEEIQFGIHCEKADLCNMYKKKLEYICQLIKGNIIAQKNMIQINKKVDLRFVDLQVNNEMVKTLDILKTMR